MYILVSKKPACPVRPVRQGDTSQRSDRSSHLERHDLSRGLLAALVDNVFEHGHLFCISGDTVTDQVICVDQVPMRHKVGRWTDPLLVVGAYTWSRHDLLQKGRVVRGS